MKIAYICGNLPHYDYGIKKLISATQEIFTELGVETTMSDLGVVHPPYYEGETHSSIDGIIENVRTANGVVFICTAQLFAPTALMQSFLEYLEQPEYHDILRDKHCYLMVVSQNGGEKSALRYLSRVVQHFGGYERWQIGLQAHHILEIDQNPDLKGIIERETEDFYRAARQNRYYIVPRDYIAGTGILADAPAGQSQSITSLPNIGVNSGIQLRDDSFSEQEEKDIDEISRLFSEKYSGKPQGDESTTTPNATASPILQFDRKDDEMIPPSQPGSKTAKQITQSLPHYFQPQLSAGMKSVIQINISGSEAFEGFLYIHGVECTYSEGTAPAPDIIIMADTDIWLDVLKNKQTAQKAFMMGGLKVRGDFVLLTKFDNLFKLG